MSDTMATLSLIPAPGTLERRLLVDVLAKMARIWIESQCQECEEQAGGIEMAKLQQQETANGAAATPGPLAASDDGLEGRHQAHDTTGPIAAQVGGGDGQSS